MSMAKNKSAYGGGETRPLAVAGCRRAFCWPGSTRWLLRMHTVCGPVFHCYSCPLATFACPIGVLANFSALHVIPFAAVGHAGGLGRRVRQFRLRLGLPVRFPARPDRQNPDAQVHAARLDGRFRYVVLVAFVLVIPYLWGEGHRVVLLPALSGGRHRRRRCRTW